MCSLTSPPNENTGNDAECNGLHLNPQTWDKLETNKRKHLIIFIMQDYYVNAEEFNKEQEYCGMLIAVGIVQITESQNTELFHLTKRCVICIAAIKATKYY